MSIIDSKPHVFSVPWFAYVEKNFGRCHFRYLLNYMLENNNLYYEPTLIKLEQIMEFENINILLTENEIEFIKYDILQHIQIKLYGNI